MAAKNLRRIPMSGAPLSINSWVRVHAKHVAAEGHGAIAPSSRLAGGGLVRKQAVLDSEEAGRGPVGNPDLHVYVLDVVADGLG